MPSPTKTQCTRPRWKSARSAPSRRPAPRSRPAPVIAYGFFFPDSHLIVGAEVWSCPTAAQQIEGEQEHDGTYDRGDEARCLIRPVPAELLADEFGDQGASNAEQRRHD